MKIKNKICTKIGKISAAKMLVALPIVVALMFGLSMANAHATDEVNAEAIVLFNNIDSAKTHEIADFINNNGGSAYHVFLSKAIIGEVPTELEQKLTNKYSSDISGIYREKIDTSKLNENLREHVAVKFWNSKFEPKIMGTSQESFGPILNDVLYITPSPERIAPVAESNYPPSLQKFPAGYLYGKIAVKIVLFESNGAKDQNTEDWTSDRESTVDTKIVEALNWWIKVKPVYIKSPVFIYADDGKNGNFLHQKFKTSYEPINGNSGDVSFSINEFFDTVGTPPGGNAVYRGEQYDKFILRQQFKTDWAFTIFVVDSHNDADGLFADSGAPAYVLSDNFPYTNGPYIVMTYDNGKIGNGKLYSYGANNMNAVAAHEIGHIFGAADQYKGAWSCNEASDCTVKFGSLGVENQNCEFQYDGQRACTSNSPSIMREDPVQIFTGQPAIDNYASGQIGWRDSPIGGMRGIVDIIESRFTGDPDIDGNGIADYWETNQGGNELKASFTVTPNPVRVNDKIIVDASASTAPVGQTIVDHTFDFGDGGGAILRGEPINKDHYYQSVGTYTIKLTVTDSADQSASTQKEIQVIDNRAPQITSYTPSETTTTLKPGTSQQFSVTATDADSDPLTYSIKLDGVEKSTQSSWTYTPTDNEVGIHTITETVSDGKLSAQQNWAVNVQNAQAVSTFTEDFSIDLSKWGTWQDGPSGGLIAIENEEASIKNGIITTKDSFSGLTKYEFDVGRIANSGDPSFYIFPYYIDDNNGLYLEKQRNWNWKLKKAVKGVVTEIAATNNEHVLGNGIEHWIVTNNNGEITVIANGEQILKGTDNENTFTSGKFRATAWSFGDWGHWHIDNIVLSGNQPPENHAPQITSFEPQSASINLNTGSQQQFLITAADSDNDPLTYSIKLDNVGKSTENSWAYAPLESEVGTHTITATVTDGKLSAEQSWTVNVQKAPEPLSIDITTPANGATFNEGDTFPIQAVASGGAGTLTYSIKINEIEIARESSAQHTWTYDDAGAHTIFAEVSDGTLVETYSVTVNVLNKNRAPILDPIGNKNVNAGETLTFSLTAIDPDNDQIIYNAQNLPQGAIFIDKIFAWTPKAEDSGLHTITFTATDGALSDEETINIEVTAIEPPKQALLSIGPSNLETQINKEIALTVALNAEQEVYAAQFEVHYDPALLEAKELRAGAFLTSDGVKIYEISNIDAQNGIISYSATRYESQKGVSGKDAIAEITFVAKEKGITAIQIKNAKISDQNIKPIEVSMSNGEVQISALPQGDVNEDGVVDIFDLAFVGKNFGKKDFEPQADVNNDGVVDIFDLAFVGKNYGNTNAAAATAQMERGANVAGATIEVTPVQISTKIGETFGANITASAGDIYASQFTLFFNPQNLEVLNVSRGTLFGNNAQTYEVAEINNTAGTVNFALTKVGNSPSSSGNGTLATLLFRAKSPGNSALSIEQVKILGSELNSLKLDSVQTANVIIADNPAQPPTPGTGGNIGSNGGGGGGSGGSSLTKKTVESKVEKKKEVAPAPIVERFPAQEIKPMQTTLKQNNKIEERSPTPLLIFNKAGIIGVVIGAIALVGFVYPQLKKEFGREISAKITPKSRRKKSR